MWLMNATESEKRDGETLSNLVVEKIVPNQLETISDIVFRRRTDSYSDLKSPQDILGSRIQLREYVIASVEALDHSKTVLHVVRGFVIGITSNTITVHVRGAIPKILFAKNSKYGFDAHWRLDKGILTTALSRAKENLTRLFVGESSENLLVGTNKTRNKFLGLEENLDPQVLGDVHHRKLIVDLTPPRFDMSNDGEMRLLNDYTRLNLDQQNAVKKVNSKTLSSSL